MKRLAEEGYQLRALARRQSDLSTLHELGAEIVFGDLGDKASISAAVQGIDVVVHAAAGTSGTAEDSDIATIQGTRNILAACRASQVKKLVYISSCSVYELAGYSEGQIVTEESQLERFPLRRGHYAAAKLQAEILVSEYMNCDGCPTVVLRPGMLYGPGADIFPRMLGLSFARSMFVIFGDGKSELPLAHVENVVDAIVKCMGSGAADNQVFNLVDQDLVTRKAYVEQLIKPLYPNAGVIYLPMGLLRALTWLQERLLAILGKQPFLTAYRLASSQKRVRYCTSKIESAIGWRPRITFAQGAEQILRLHRQSARSR